MKYYLEYFAALALLQKTGIKTEIHDCAIEAARFLEEKQAAPQGIADKLEEDKKLRIKNQYYLKNIPAKINYKELDTLLLQTKQVINSQDEEKTEEIREELKELLKPAS